jgi:hypothetical protein
MDGYCFVCIKSKDGMSYFSSLSVMGSMNYLISLIDTKVKWYEQATQEEAKSEL